MFNRRTLTVIGAGALLFAAATPPLLAGAESPGAGSTTTNPATGGPTTSAGGEFVLPPGFEFLVDDTNRITVAVPTTWIDISTTPTTFGDALIPQINASTDLDAWESTSGAPGVLYAAFPFTSDVQARIDEVTPPSGCASDDVVPYADGVFSGSHVQWTECGATGQGALHLIVASPADQTFTAVVSIQLTGPQDQQALDVVLETFNVTASATWPASAPASSTTSGATTVPAPPVTTTAGAAATRHVVDRRRRRPATTVGATTVPGPTTGARSDNHGAGSDDHRAAHDRGPPRRRDQLPDGYRAGGLDRPEPFQQPTRRR